MEENAADIEDKEAGRLCRLLLFKQRERQSVRKAQIKTVFDKSMEEKRKSQDIVEKANKILNDSIGVSIEGYTPEGKKVPSKYYLVRGNEYQDEVPIPFSDKEKELFGILTYIFMIIYFNKNIPTTYENINTSLKLASLENNIFAAGGLKELLKTWVKQEYLIETKKEDELDNVYTFGPRFNVEIGIEALDQIIDGIIDTD